MNHPSRTGGTLVQPATPAHPLRAHATGLLAQTAAVDLLIAHRYWLTRSAFTDQFVHPVTTHDGRQSGAWIDWAAAIAALQRGELPCSASEACQPARWTAPGLVEARFPRDRSAGHGLILCGPVLVASASYRRTPESTGCPPWWCAAPREWAAGQAVRACPVPLAVQGAAEVSGVKGEGRRPVAAAIAQRPLRPEGRARSLRGALGRSAAA
jgi:hypothetical protein